MKNIGVVGLGLIGGSLCKAIKAYTDCDIFGYDIDEAIVYSAIEYGAIDAQLTKQNLSKCDLIIFALYPANTIAYVKDYLNYFQQGCILMDMCGVKEVVCNSIQEIIKGYEITFIGGHPMAGREFSGFAVSDKDLFQHASMILTPFQDTKKSVLNTVSQFLLTLGFERVIDTTPQFHDKMIAYTSQLPHVIANSYVKNPNCCYQLGFTGGSFEDMSRVAKLNEQMWTELFLENRENLIQEITILIENLCNIKNALEQSDVDKLRSLLAEGRVIKESLK